MFEIISKTYPHDKTISIINSYLQQRQFVHIISLNPENFVQASTNKQFAKAYTNAELIIIDGAGIHLAAQMLNIPAGDRITGVDLLQELVLTNKGKRIVFLGGFDGSAVRTIQYFADHAKLNNPQWFAIADVDKDDSTLIHKVLQLSPDLLFVAFGSPAQELWIEQYRQQLSGILCMGVGQAFDVYSGLVSRAPSFVRSIGFEWLYRLITQPWRWRRQLQLFQFIFMTLRYRYFRQ